MRKHAIIVPDLHLTPGQAHAVRLDDILYTSSFAAVDRHGQPRLGDTRAQIRYIYESLDKVLRHAGASWKDVARICHYAPADLSSEMDALIGECLTEFLPDRSCAITVAPLWNDDGDAPIKAELIAQIGGEKRLLMAPEQQRQAGLRIGRHIYLSSHIASRTVGLAEETREIYGDFDTLLTEAGSTWDNVLRVRQYVTHTDIDFNDVRRGREAFVPLGRFLSTSVASLARADRRDDRAIAVDLEAIAAPKIMINTSALPHTPGTAHAIRAGNLVHVQAQIAEEHSAILYPGSITGQTLHVLGVLSEIMAAAGVTWDQVISSRAFCKRPADLAEVRRLERHYAGAACFAQTDLVARFFDPDVLVEMEITAHQ